MRNGRITDRLIRPFRRFRRSVHSLAEQCANLTAGLHLLSRGPSIFRNLLHESSMSLRLVLSFAAVLGAATPLSGQVATPATTAAAAAPRFDNTGVGDTSIFAPLD